jgi:magnesium transporter
MHEAVKCRVKELIEQHQWRDLRESIAEIPVPDAADLLVSLAPSEKLLFLTTLPPQFASDVFAELTPTDKDALLRSMADREVRELLAGMAPDDRTEMFAALGGQATQHLLNLLNPEDLAETRQLLGYPEDSVGRLMTPDYVAVRPDWTIARAIEHIRGKGKGSETIGTIYVTDDKWRLLDALDLGRFILADPSRPVESIMDHSFTRLRVADDREEAVRVMERYDLAVLPVVDAAEVLLGIVTVDDVLDVAREEATEDFQRTAAVAPLGVAYPQATIPWLYAKRVGWLLLLVIINLASSGVIAAFEETLSATIALAFFIPLLIDSGGNTGAQAATLTIRALATNELHLSQWIRTLVKELGVGLLLGLSMAVAAFLLGWMRGGAGVAAVVGITMLALVLVANIIGAALPFILNKFRIDPAVASSPLITTVVDATGLLIYFGVAAIIL